MASAQVADLIQRLGENIGSRSGSRPSSRPITPTPSNEEGRAPSITSQDNRRSRHNSRNQQGSLNDDDFANYRDQLLELEMNPLGRILSCLVKDQINLATKAGVRETNSSITALCDLFALNQDLERDKYKFNALETTEKVMTNMISRELNSHLLHQDFKAPTTFSTGPTLRTTSQKAEAMRVFPTRGQKFSGTNENSASVVEFLSMMRSAQDQCNLSRKEFLDMLLLCTTGLAHSLLVDWINQGENVETIYHSYLLHFDKRQSPEDARIKLMTFKANKTMSLKTVESKIMMLASRSSSTLPPGASQAASYNNDAIQALIRSLPLMSSTTVQNTYYTLSAKLARSATYVELTRALNMYRSTIDQDIAKNGIEANRGKQDFSVRPKFRKTKKADPIRTYQVDCDHSGTCQAMSYQVTPDQSRSQGQNRSGGTQNRRQNNMPQQSNSDRNNQGYNNSRGNGNNSSSNNRKFKRPPKKDSLGYCSLCGQNDHRAADTCPNMQSDHGKIIKILPSLGTCNKCPPSVTPRLNHPAMMCPFRPTGPLHGTM